jgi:hypothetical protein
MFLRKSQITPQDRDDFLVSYMAKEAETRVSPPRSNSRWEVFSVAAYSERSKNMSTRKWIGIVVLTALMTSVPTTWGQWGMGDNEGVVRQALQTQRTVIEGTVKEIVTETCENTTGPFATGMHLLLTTSEERQYNVHLGPVVLVKDLLAPLKAGQSVTVQVFRTENMPAEHSVAITLTCDGKTVRLRDENLRPVWAGRQGRFFGRGVAAAQRPQWGQGYTRSYGMRMGTGFRAGYGMAMRRGYGWSNGTGYGRGQSGRGQRRGLGLGYGPGICPWGTAILCRPYADWGN